MTVQPRSDDVAGSIPAAAAMPDESALAARLGALRAVLRPVDDPALADALKAARASLSPAYARELEREAAYERNLNRGSGAGQYVSAEERARCEWCYGFVAHRYAVCQSPTCGHAPDLAIGHRQSARTERQAGDARARLLAAYDRLKGTR